MLSFNLDKGNCTGCSACYAICPKHCIFMKKDAEGFIYPEVGDGCISCGLCEKVCPNVHDKPIQTFKKRAFAATAKDENIWRRSASGGAFSCICKAFGDEKTLVVGAAWDGLKVHHVGIVGVDNIVPLCKSKYVASQLEDTFQEIKNHLRTGEKAIFCGTPCQVAGLNAFLQKSYSNLLTIDLICHGVGSPYVFEEAITAIGEQAGDKVLSYEFRHKNRRYESDYITSVVFENQGRKQLINDQYMQLFLSQISLRPSCGKNCKYRNPNRPGDITIADARGLKYFIHKAYDTTRNYTHVVVNTEKGLNAIENISKYMVIYPCEVSDVTRFNPLFERHTVFNEDRNKFFEEFVKDGPKTIGKYTKNYKIKKMTWKSLLRFYFPKVIVMAIDRMRR